MVSTMITVGFSSGDISTIASIAVFGIFLVYAIVNLSLIWSRFRNHDYKRPFVPPIRIGKFRVLAGMGLITSLAMLFQLDSKIVIGGFLVLLSSVVLSVVLLKGEYLGAQIGQKNFDLIFLLIFVRMFFVFLL